MSRDVWDICCRYFFTVWSRGRRGQCHASVERCAWARSLRAGRTHSGRPKGTRFSIAIRALLGACGSKSQTLRSQRPRLRRRCSTSHPHASLPSPFPKYPAAPISSRSRTPRPRATFANVLRWGRARRARSGRWLWPLGRLSDDETYSHLTPEKRRLGAGAIEASFSLTG